jgi:hypothetical protein
VIIDVEPAEWDSLLRWKKRSDSFVLTRLKAEAVMLASKDVSGEVIAAMVDRSEKTVRSWLRDWRARRLGSVTTGHAGNENAATLTRGNWSGRAIRPDDPMIRLVTCDNVEGQLDVVQYNLSSFCRS